MQKVIALFFMLAALVCSAMLIWTGVDMYHLRCANTDSISCKLTHLRNDERTTWDLTFTEPVKAEVVKKPVRRGTENVYLYLISGERKIFVAHYLGSDRYDAVVNDASMLNTLFTRKGSIVNVKQVPPSYFGWLSWAGIALLLGFGVALYRQK